MYTTEDEEFERIKRWFASYGIWLLALVVLAALGFGGWKGWGYYQARQGTQASALYSQFQKAVQNKNTQAIDSTAQKLTGSYAGTPYAALAQLMRAKLAVTGNKLDAAASDLQWVIAHGSQTTLRTLATLRLAQVRVAQKRPDAALVLLNSSLPTAYMPLAKQIQGDAWLIKGDDAKARAAYEEALASAQLAGLPTETLQMKIAALPANTKGGA
ncbi:YfgM family protein [Acidihalobacter ferrooxydans]|uniref:Ancillary SecYEG translocon subunit n=1 Tax=Acidihalobacter ferrooxydans TaxID=1765967 RepID=A0A1P8UGW8_9GAMM|nr:tetratricopeptide repeat protein [Acidihalobacter ferrooxydans]APZ43069.1 hypothetical protein BW247_08170 [Acidihalobacter ferrooxydans]